MPHPAWRVFFLITLLTACANPQTLQRHSQRQIDRPYTLPQGINTWSTTGIFSLGQETGRNSESKLFIFPWFWEQSLTDQLALGWSPLPTEVKLQLFQDTKSYLGGRLNLLGSPLFLFLEFNLTPLIELTYMHRLSSNFALKHQLLTQLELRRASNPLHGIFAYQFVPFFQIRDDLTLQPYIQAYLEMGNPRTGYLPFYPLPSVESPRLRIPLGLKFSASWIPYWDFTLEYRYLGLLYSNSFENQQWIFSSTHFF